MAKTHQQTPKITPRPIKFEFHGPVERYWYQNNIAGTMCGNILAAYIPYGEKFFIKSVKAVKHKIQNPKLQAEAQDFIKQESFHSREHLVFFNRNVKPFYPGILKYPIELAIPTLLATILGPKFRLSLTAAGEHFTAVGGHVFLSNPELVQNVDADIKAMWQWHCIEEIEHKSVAFDVMQDLKMGYCWRMSGFLALNLFYSIGFLRPVLYIMIKDRAFFSAKFYKDCWRFFFSQSKIVPRFFPMFYAYFKPGFHPWQQKNYHLIQSMAQTLDSLDSTRAQQSFLSNISLPRESAQPSRPCSRWSLFRKKAPNK